MRRVRNIVLSVSAAVILIPGVAAAQAALRAVQRAQERLSLSGENADLYAEAADDVLALYRNRLQGRRRTADRSSQGRRLAEAEQRLWLAGLRAERTAVQRSLLERRRESKMPQIAAIRCGRARYGVSTDRSL